MIHEMLDQVAQVPLAEDHDQFCLGREEIDDVLPENCLPAKRNASPRSSQASKRRLGTSTSPHRSAPHRAQLCSTPFARNEAKRSEHGLGRCSRARSEASTRDRKLTTPY